MATYHLYRAKLICKSQPTLFDNEYSRENIIIAIINSKPSYKVGNNQVWHIGNVTEIDAHSIFFAIGKTTTRGKSLYDEDKGEFIEVEDEESPYTYVYYNAKYSIMAIMYNSKVSPYIKTIANKISTIINENNILKNSSYQFVLSEIWNPRRFIEYIKNAARVISFTVSVTRPNPFDVDNDFHRPLEKYVEAAEAETGKTTVTGKDLNRNIIIKIAHSIAATGDDATARIKEKDESRAITKRIQGDSVTVTIEEEDKYEISKKIVATYEAIRKDVNSENQDNDEKE